MVIIVYGTTGELIKILPILKVIPKDQQVRICTYQQPHQLKQLVNEVKLDAPNYGVGRNPEKHDLESIKEVPWWAIKTNLGLFNAMRKVRKQHGRKNTVVLVHGDTMTTVFGALWGRLLGFPVGHIEAGLRSHNWRHPFPEEIDRLLTSRLARMHFAPGDVPVENLHKAKAKGDIVPTTYNTVLDSLRMAQKDTTDIGYKLPKKFAVVSIHRNELLVQKEELESFLKTIRKQAEKDNIIFLDHPVTKQRMNDLQLNSILEHKNITRLPKLSYYRFIKLVAKADYVLTDSGGLQEETAYLGIPCLVHRMATEREEGLGKNVVLSLYDQKIVNDFLKDPYKLAGQGVSSKISPTKTILDYLKNKHFIS